jgi:hypothetical protein
MKNKMKKQFCERKKDNKTEKNKNGKEIQFVNARRGYNTRLNRNENAKEVHNWKV